MIANRKEPPRAGVCGAEAERVMHLLSSPECEIYTDKRGCSNVRSSKQRVFEGSILLFICRFVTEVRV